MFFVPQIVQVCATSCPVYASWNLNRIFAHFEPYRELRVSRLCDEVFHTFESAGAGLFNTGEESVSACGVVCISFRPDFE